MVLVCMLAANACFILPPELACLVFFPYLVPLTLSFIIPLGCTMIGYSGWRGHVRLVRWVQRVVFRVECGC
jgi:hypothetical protein